MPAARDASPTVEAALQFGKRRSDDETFYFYQTAELPQNVQQRSNVNLEEAMVTFTDMRTSLEPFTLLRNGFTLESLQSPTGLQWDDADQVLQLTFPL